MTTEIRNQFIKDIKLVINEEYVEKYKFLTEVYQHYFDYFVRDNMPIHNND